MSADTPIQKCRLSVAMIVRDAEDLLADSILSVQAIADEVVVLDTGSTDRSVEVAQGLGARVVERAWDDDFSSARNFCGRQARGDWILWLDAGERLSEEAAAQIRDLVAVGGDSRCAYMLLVELPAAVLGAAAEQVGQIRLVPRSDEVQFAGRVREQIRPSIEAAGLTIDALAGKIIRTPRDHEPQVKARRAERNKRLAEMEIRDGGPAARLFNLLGEAQSDLTQASAARGWFQQALAASESGSTDMLEAYYGVMTSYDGQPGGSQEQIKICLEALELFPFDAQLLCAMGNYLQGQQRPDLAIKAYKTAVQFGQVNPETWHLCNIGEVAAVCLSATYQMLENHEAARRTLEEALARNESSIRMRRQLIDLHVAHNRRKEALDEVDRLGDEVPQRDSLRSAVRGACLASQKSWVMALAHLKTAHAAGCRDSLCLRWLAMSLLATGELDALGPILAEWRQADPHSVEALRYQEAMESMQAGEGTSPAAAPARHLRMDTGASGAHADVPQPSVAAHLRSEELSDLAGPGVASP
ncbi:MAG: glycosyltransferase [Planctomycetes bacterium]|nr:glycosyltransferase [Planctomycetota bacterium]